LALSHDAMFKGLSRINSLKKIKSDASIRLSNLNYKHQCNDSNIVSDLDLNIHKYLHSETITVQIDSKTN